MRDCKATQFEHAMKTSPLRQCTLHIEGTPPAVGLHTLILPACELILLLQSPWVLCEGCHVMS